MYDPPPSTHLEGHARIRQAIEDRIELFAADLRATKGDPRGALEAFAASCGIPSNMIGYYRRGRLPRSRLRQQQLAHGLGWSYSYLLSLLYPEDAVSLPPEPEPDDLDVLEQAARGILSYIARRKPQPPTDNPSKGGNRALTQRSELITHMGDYGAQPLDRIDSVGERTIASNMRTVKATRRGAQAHSRTQDRLGRMFTKVLGDW